jgi:RsiW-degrading membrane proteinase PrsW (M82 family)
MSIPPFTGEKAERQYSDMVKWRILAPFAVIIGGVFGVLGAVFQEFLHGSLFVAFVAGPMIEEVMKPAGVYLILAINKSVLKRRVYTALLAGLGGLTFGVIENLIYLNLYFPEHTRNLVIFRYTVGLGMHTITSFIVGFGINERLLRSVRGEIPFLRGNWKYFIIPMVIHSLFNIAIVIFGNRLMV